jgi:hypothetical protein
MALRALSIAVAFILVAADFSEAFAQCCGGGRSRRQSVGGVFIDVDGVLRSATLDQFDELRQFRLQAMQEQDGDLTQPTELRKVSLRMLEEAIADSLQTGNRPPDVIRYLAGLQTIRYVLVYPEQKDIVLVGYGEGWTVDKKGFVVGKTTGRPVLLLDDLVVALRSARRAAEGGITCSIDPTPEGIAKLRQYASTLKTASDVSIDTVEQTLGPQTITVGGVPAWSHFARVLVAADYRMKRLGMKLDASPVPGLPSYLDMVAATGSGMQSMTPRWWLVANYEPMLTDAEGLAWELRGRSVKTMTEDSFFAADGSKKQAGKTSPAAQRWADLMTAKYEALAAKEPIFAELRNCMDLAIVSALIAKENLGQKAGYSFSVLTDPTQFPGEEGEVPRTTPSKASIIPKGGSIILSASGGVEIRPYDALEKVERTQSLGPIVEDASPTTATRWWWN